MKTSKGATYTTLLAVNVQDGDLHLSIRVPMELGDISHDAISAMIPFINERISTEKKPGATFAKALESIDYHRQQLAQSYTTLFETYQRATSVQTRTSPVIKAHVVMLEKMPEAMLRQFGTLQLGADRMMDYILPDDKEQLVRDIAEAMAA